MLERNVITLSLLVFAIIFVGLDEESELIGLGFS